MPVDPKLVDLRIDQRVVADKHVNLGQHVNGMLHSRYDHEREVIAKIVATSSLFARKLVRLLSLFRLNRISLKSNEDSSAEHSLFAG